MVFSGVFSTALVVVLLLAQGGPAEATQVQLFSPSVRVNGMGQAGVALPDEPAGYYNPSSAALSSPAHTLQSRFYLSEMPIFADASSTITYSYFAAQAATERVFNRLSWKGPTRLRAAFYGYRTKLDSGPVAIPNETSTAIDTFFNAEVANNIGISLALRSVVDLGIGATARWISAEILGAEGSAKTYDLGLMVVVPVVDVVKCLTRWDFARNHPLRPKLDVGLGVMWQNRGRAAITYIARQGPLVELNLIPSSPLPATKRHGWSGSLGMDWSSDSLTLALGRVTFSQEISRRTYYPYEEDAYVPTAERDNSGVEVSIMETVSIRRGTSDLLDDYIDLKTSGWTVKSDGLFKIIAHFLDSKSPSSERDALQFLARHLSISWSRFDDRGWSLLSDDRSHSFIGLSF